jgi:hypothetical protein
MENEMGQELLTPRWEKKPRLYYKATNEKGYIVTRGSAHKRYSYCAVASDFNRWGGLWSAWASTEELAKKYARQMQKNNDSIKFEVVKVEETNAKEVRLIKKQMTLECIGSLSEGKNLQEQENN